MVPATGPPNHHISVLTPSQKQGAISSSVGPGLDGFNTDLPLGGGEFGKRFLEIQGEIHLTCLGHTAPSAMVQHALEVLPPSTDSRESLGDWLGLARTLRKEHPN